LIEIKQAMVSFVEMVRHPWQYPNAMLSLSYRRRRTQEQI